MLSEAVGRPGHGGRDHDATGSGSPGAARARPPWPRRCWRADDVARAVRRLRAATGTTTAADPVVAELDRIAFLLERGGRRHPARDGVPAGRRRWSGRPGADEIAARDAPGQRSRSCPASATAPPRSSREVVSTAAVSGYRRRPGGRWLAPLVAGGHALRAALQGDLHSHTDASDGGSDLATMARTAASLGHRYLAVTDHSPRLTVANGLSPERLRGPARARRAGAGRARRGRRGPAGADRDRGRHPRRRLARPGPRPARPPRRGGRLRALQAGDGAGRHDPPAGGRGASDPLVDVLGHCTGRLLGGRSARLPGREPRQQGPAAVDLRRARPSSRPRSRRAPRSRSTRGPSASTPRCDLLAAGRRGRLRPVSVDSDAHAPGQLDWQVLGCARVEQVGIDADRVINTWDVDRLLHRLHAG